MGNLVTIQPAIKHRHFRVLLAGIQRRFVLHQFGGIKNANDDLKKILDNRQKARENDGVFIAA